MWKAPGPIRAEPPEPWVNLANATAGGRCGIGDGYIHLNADGLAFVSRNYPSPP